jgi:hypothetical protein
MLERFRDLIESSPDSMLMSNESSEVVLVDFQAENLLECTGPERLSRWAAKSFSSPTSKPEGKLFW